MRSIARHLRGTSIPPAGFFGGRSLLAGDSECRPFSRTRIAHQQAPSLGPAFVPEHCGAGVVLAGGTAKLPGIEEAASRVFGLPARRGEPPGWVKEELQDPMFSTVLGVFQFGLRTAHEHAVPPRRKTGLLSNLTKIFAAS